MSDDLRLSALVQLLLSACRLSQSLFATWFFQLVFLTFLLVFSLFQGEGCGTLLCGGCEDLNGVVVELLADWAPKCSSLSLVAMVRPMATQSVVVVVRIVVTVAERIVVTVAVLLWILAKVAFSSSVLHLWRLRHCLVGPEMPACCFLGEVRAAVPYVEGLQMPACCFVGEVRVEVPCAEGLRMPACCFVGEVRAEVPCAQGLEGPLSECLRQTSVRFATTYLEGGSYEPSGVLHLNLTHTCQRPEIIAHAVAVVWAVAWCHRKHAKPWGATSWAAAVLSVVTSLQAPVEVLLVAPSLGHASISALPRRLEVAHSLQLQLKQPSQGRSVFVVRTLQSKQARCSFAPVVEVVL